MEIITKSFKETIKVAYDYTKTLSQGDVVILDGDMGAGKTTFTKGMKFTIKIKGEVLWLFVLINLI